MTRNQWSADGKSRKVRSSKTTKDSEKQDSAKDSTNRSRRLRAKGNGITYLIILMTALLVGAIYLGFQFTDQLLAVDNETILDEDNNKAVDKIVIAEGLKKRDVLTILIIGTDQRGREAARSDTTMLAMFDKEDKEVHLFSVPRDTRAAIPGRGTEKLNHAYAYGGGELAKKTTEQLLDIEIDGFISTNFSGFGNIVDIIGGIELNVEMRMDYSPEGIDLYPGQQKLDGNKALQYVRYRSDGRGDLGRMERQQKFLKVLAGELLTVSNVPQIPNLVKEFNENVKTDMNLKDMITVANMLRSVKLDNLNAQTLPGEAVWIGEVSYWELDKKETKEILNKILYEEEKP